MLVMLWAPNVWPRGVNKIDPSCFRARACDLLGWRQLQIMTQPIEPNSAVVTAIENRRTIHEFRPDPIAEETLWRILDAARWAPNHRLTEPWRFTIEDFVRRLP